MSARFTITETPLAGLKLLTRTKRSDERGFLSRLFCAEELAEAGWREPVSQINETGTLHRGTVRGLHFQHPPFAEMKLVTCTQGAILDVVVDLRQKSLTFLQHFAVELSADNNYSLLIPKGFAHGFQALSQDVRLIYLHSAPWNGEAEDGLNALDPGLGISWPLPVQHQSARDLGFGFLPQNYSGVAA